MASASIVGGTPLSYENSRIQSHDNIDPSVSPAFLMVDIRLLVGSPHVWLICPSGPPRTLFDRQEVRGREYGVMG